MTLTALLAEHRGPLTADLHRYHRISVSRLSECGLPLREVAAIVAHLPEDSATFKALNPQWPHSFDLEMLRSMEQSLRWLGWSKTDKGSKGRDIPEFFDFPWEVKPATGGYQGDSMTMEEAAMFLGWEEQLKGL